MWIKMGWMICQTNCQHLYQRLPAIHKYFWAWAIRNQWLWALFLLKWQQRDSNPNHLVRNWAVLWVLTCSVHLTVYYYHVISAFQSESTLYSCLNVKELFTQNRCDIWSLSDSNRIWSHRRLVRKRTTNLIAKLVKWLSCVVGIICTVHFTVRYYHVTYSFEAESTLYSCLNYTN